jgi:hypothetical protein
MPRRRETNMEELSKLKLIIKVTNHYLTAASYKLGRKIQRFSSIFPNKMGEFLPKNFCCN